MSFNGYKKVKACCICNSKDLEQVLDMGKTPLDYAEREPRPNRNYSQIKADKKEIADLLRKHGGKTGEELKAEGK